MKRMNHRNQRFLPIVFVLNLSTLTQLLNYWLVLLLERCEWLVVQARSQIRQTGWLESERKQVLSLFALPNLLFDRIDLISLR